MSDGMPNLLDLLKSDREREPQPREEPTEKVRKEAPQPNSRPRRPGRGAVAPERRLLEGPLKKKLGFLMPEDLREEIENAIDSALGGGRFDFGGFSDVVREALARALSGTLQVSGRPRTGTRKSPTSVMVNEALDAEVRARVKKQNLTRFVEVAVRSYLSSAKGSRRRRWDGS